MKVKPLLCTLLCLCMLSALLPSLTSAQAKPDVIFTVVNNVLRRPMSENEMPVSENSDIYIPFYALASLVTVRLYMDEELNQLIYYRGDSRVTFDLAGNRAFDETGKRLSPAAIYRNGTVYIPAAMLCEKFGLYFSLVNTPVSAPMIRINEGELVGTDKEYMTQLQSLFQSVYDDYISSPDEPIASEPAPARIAYLAFEGMPKDSDILLEKLGEIKVSFFLTPDEIKNNGDFLRKAVSSGHSAGVLLDTSLPLSPQLSSAKYYFNLHLCAPVELARLSGDESSASQSELSELIASGLRVWSYNTVYSELTDGSFAEKVTSNSQTGFSAIIRVLPDEISDHTLSSAIAALEDLSFSVLPISRIYTP